MSMQVEEQCLIGMRCQEFSILAADQMSTQGITIYKNDDDKIHQLSEKLLIGVNGDPGDCVQFTQFVAKNLQLYKMRNGYPLSNAAAVNFIRMSMDKSRYVLNMLCAGHDDTESSQLYSVDFLATRVKLPYACHGYGGVICTGVLDEYYRLTLSELEAYEVLKMCIKEIHLRLYQNLSNFQVKVVSKNGVRTLPAITHATLV